MSDNTQSTDPDAAIKELEHELELLRTTTRMASVGGWELDLENDTVCWTKETTCIFESEDIETRSIETALNYFEAEHRTQLEDAINKCKHEGKPYDLELLIRTEKGNRKWVHTTGEKHISGDNQVLRASINDVTAIKKLQQLLATTSRMAKVGGWELDSNTNELTWTEETYRIFEVDFNEGISLESAIAFHSSDDRVRIEKALENLQSTGTSFDMEAMVLTAKGNEKWVRVMGERRLYESKSCILGGTIMDITEIKQTQQALVKAREESESANKAKSEFLANMSHEIRTPLNGVQGYLQLLSFSELNEEQSDFIQSAMQSSESLITIINDILDLSKIESGKVVIDNRKFTFQELFDSLSSLFGKRVKQKGMEFSLNKDDDVPDVIIGDLSRIRQILVNLIGNSTKFTDTGSIKTHVQLIERESPDKIKLRFTVIDTGIGISKHQQKTIFEPFTQGDSSYTKKFEGTGLGLSIVKHLVELMNGSINLESEDSVGTKIDIDLSVICLDAIETQQQHKQDKLNKVDIKSPNSLHILVVEDDINNAVVISKMLKLFGHTYDVSNDGQEALDKLLQDDFDLVLMDLQMPVLDGIEATRIIRNDERFASQSRIPIIALTAHAMDIHKEQCVAAGMNDFLSKPIILKSIKSILEEYAS